MSPELASVVRAVLLEALELHPDVRDDRSLAFRIKDHFQDCWARFEEFGVTNRHDLATLTVSISHSAALRHTTIDLRGTPLEPPPKPGIYQRSHA